MNAQEAYENLAPFVQEFIYKMGWQELRQLQVESIDAILNTKSDILISTGTASGKTEAAFLPIISQISKNQETSIKVIYVGPLKALINDQFRRLEQLCENGGISIHRWHGDIAANHKADLINYPNGILQITPESIESLFINRTKNLRNLFHGLEYIVIDEVHSFLETDRGTQLQSLLERFSIYTQIRPRRIGLSATIGDFDIAKRWMSPNNSTSVRIINPDIAIPSTRLSHYHFISNKTEIPEELLDDIYKLTINRKSIIFCNNRGFVEQATNHLNRLCHRDNINERYLPHHGSVSKEIREDAENKMREEGSPYSVICTNTLELGIDVGQLELSIQIDSTHSVMSFVQRLGRTGRNQGEPRIMQLYTTEIVTTKDSTFFSRIPFSLLKSIAIVDLFTKGWIEPPEVIKFPYNVLYHQTLSLLMQINGSSPNNLINFFKKSGAFNNISIDEIILLYKHLTDINHIEHLETGEMILGLEGEKNGRSRDFYAVFQTPQEWDVVESGKNIGSISPRYVEVGGCFLLSGQLWEITEFYPNEKLVLVKRALDARNILFDGSGDIEMHPVIAKRVFDFLCRKDEPNYLSKVALTRLIESRQLFIEMGLNSKNYIESSNHWILFPWSGSKISRTLNLLFNRAGFHSIFPFMFFPWVMVITKSDTSINWKSAMEIVKVQALGLDSNIELISDIPVKVIRTQKFDENIPEELLRKRAANNWIDLPGALNWIEDNFPK